MGNRTMKHNFIPCHCEMCSSQWAIVRCAICGDYDKECNTEPIEVIHEENTTELTQFEHDMRSTIKA